MTTRTLTTLLPAAAALAAATALAQPLTTGFTYQGELRSAGVPASGLHDLRFRLYDAAVQGSQVGPALCSDNVSLANGRFTVDLDFGAVFAGQQRFLEIDVRADTGLGCGNAAGFTPWPRASLSPPRPTPPSRSTPPRRPAPRRPQPRATRRCSTGNRPRSTRTPRTWPQGWFLAASSAEPTPGC